MFLEVNLLLVARIFLMKVRRIILQAGYATNRHSAEKAQITENCCAYVESRTDDVLLCDTSFENDTDMC